MKNQTKPLSLLLAALLLCSGCKETTGAANTAETTTTTAVETETTTTAAETEVVTTTTTAVTEDIAEVSKEMLEIENNAVISCDIDAVDIIVPEGVTVIQGDLYGRYGAFQNCWNLKTVTLPDSIINVRENSFTGCEDVKIIYKDTEYTPDKIKELNEAMTSLYIEDDVLIMGARGIETLEIPEGVTKIDGGAFMYSEKLKEIIIPESLTTLDGFYCCEGLTSLDIPGKVKTVNGFSGCINLKNVVIGEGVEEISGFSGCISLENINIPESVTTLGTCAFEGCTGLKEIILPSSLKEIKYAAFRNCTGLMEITVPDNTVVYPYAFEGCTGLTVNYKGRAYTYESFGEIYDPVILESTEPDSWGFVESYTGSYYQYQIKGETE